MFNVVKLFMLVFAFTLSIVFYVLAAMYFIAGYDTLTAMQLWALGYCLSAATSYNTSELDKELTTND